LSLYSIYLILNKVDHKGTSACKRPFSATESGHVKKVKECINKKVSVQNHTLILNK